MRNRLAALGALMLASSAFIGPTDAPAAPIVFFDIAGPDAGRLRDFYSANFAWSIAESVTSVITTTTLLTRPSSPLIGLMRHARWRVPDSNRWISARHGACGRCLLVMCDSLL